MEVFKVEKSNVLMLLQKLWDLQLKNKNVDIKFSVHDAFL
jgi:hypothetical protein